MSFPECLIPERFTQPMEHLTRVSDWMWLQDKR